MISMYKKQILFQRCRMYHYLNHYMKENHEIIIEILYFLKFKFPERDSMNING